MALLTKPYQTQPKLLEWACDRPDIVSIESVRAYTGMNVYAVTLTDRSIDDSRKVKLLFAQPHAHEPATTAGMMSFMGGLMEGEGGELLKRAALTFIPDGNPDGRSRSPEEIWDGTKYSNEEFLKIAFGIDENGERFPRMGRWSLEEYSPKFIGIVYEGISPKEFVEPNRDLESSFSKLVMRAIGRGCDGYLSLHQTEFERSEHNAMILLPFNFEELPRRIKERSVRWAEAIIGAWREAGANPVPEPKPLGYAEDQLKYFRRCWGRVYEKLPCLTVEVQNNNTRTPPEMQVRLIEAAIKATIEFFLEENDGRR